MTDGENNEIKLEYDLVNRVAAITRPLGARTSFAYNEIDKITQVTHPNGLTRKS